MNVRAWDKSWLPLIVLVTTIVAVTAASFPDVSATTNPVLSKPLAVLAKANNFLWGLLLGILADWLLFTLPSLPESQPPAYTVQWFERQRLKVALMVAGVITMVFSAGAGGLAS